MRRQFIFDAGSAQAKTPRSPVPIEELGALAEKARLKITELYGDYGGGSYDEASSPVIIAVFEKAR